jgi:hypothetical protein
MKKPLDERRKILTETMKEIPGRIMFSEQTLIKKKDELRNLMQVSLFYFKFYYIKY